VVRFVDIGRIVDHHCFVDIGRIVDHHCFVDIGRIVDHHGLYIFFMITVLREY
jgi:hypothetical protein